MYKVGDRFEIEIKSVTQVGNEYLYKFDFPDSRYVEKYQIDALKKLDDGWIPVEERLPEENEDVLVTYNNKEDEYAGIDITSYGKLYNLSDYKNWRSPFTYFHENYKIVAWEKLPEPYKNGDESNEN